MLRGGGFVNKVNSYFSVLAALIFTFSVALSGCRPGEVKPTISETESSSTVPSQSINATQSSDSQFTEDTSAGDPTATDPAVPTDSTESTTQAPTNSATNPTQGATGGSTAATSSSQSVTTEPTQQTESSTPTNQTNTVETTESTVIPAETTTEPDDGLLTYAEYVALSGAEKYQYYLTFPNKEAFNAWLAEAKEDDESRKNKVDIGDGSVDLDDIVNGNS